MTEVALVENLQREGLDPIEEALAYQGLMDTYKQTQEMISARLGRSRSYIANMVRLLKLCDSVQKDLIEGDLTVGQAHVLCWHCVVQHNKLKLLNVLKRAS